MIEVDSFLEFIRLGDMLKQVERRSRLTDGSRRENSAEHSWHLGVLAIALARAVEFRGDIGRVLALVAVHDLPEALAGDTPIFDAAAREGAADREREAAARIFALAGDATTRDLHALWDEFEEGVTDEARFARVLDRIHPFLQNYLSGGATWRENGITEARSREYNREVMAYSPALAVLCEELYQRARLRGFFAPPA